METPGHTPESITVLVYEHADDEVPYAALTGDALFIGDVGRPDLLASIGVTAEELGKMLYNTIQVKLMGLPDEVRVFPAHGAGSSCGKNLSTEKQSTIGEQRKFNYACQPMTEAQFLDVVTAGQPPAPEYFVYNATINRKNRAIRELGVDLVALSPEQVEAELAAGATLVDAREITEFAGGHIRGSINIPVDGRMAETIGMVLKPTDRIILVTPEGEEEEAAIRFVRIGYDNVAGFIARPEAYMIDHQDKVARSQPDLPVEARRPAVRRHPARRRAQHRGDRGHRHDRRRGAHPARGAGSAQRGARPHPSDGDVLRRRLALERRAATSAAAGFEDVSDVLGGYAGWEATHSAAV